MNLNCNKCGTPTHSEYGLCRKCKKEARAKLEAEAYGKNRV